LGWTACARKWRTTARDCSVGSPGTVWQMSTGAVTMVVNSSPSLMGLQEGLSNHSMTTAACTSDTHERASCQLRQPSASPRSLPVLRCLTIARLRLQDESGGGVATQLHAGGTRDRRVGKAGVVAAGARRGTQAGWPGVAAASAPLPLPLPGPHSNGVFTLQLPQLKSVQNWIWPPVLSVLHSTW